MPPARKSSPDAARFGAIMRRLRLERGWTLVEVARQMRMSPQYMGHLEKGDNSPSLETLLDLADLFGADAGGIVSEIAAGRIPGPRRTRR